MPVRPCCLPTSAWFITPLSLLFAAGVFLAGAVPIRAAPQRPPPTSAATTPVPPGGPLALTGVTVVDVRNGLLQSDQTVVIVGNRIRAIGPANVVPVPKDVRVVNAQGQYLIPGLWDMHTHVQGYPDVFFPLLIAHGVTGIRDMHGRFLDSMLQRRRDIMAGTRVGPRMLVTGGYLAGRSSNSGWTSVIEVTTAARARVVIDSLKAAGADHIKVRSDLSRAAYFAIAAETRRAGIPLVGHLLPAKSGKPVARRRADGDRRIRITEEGNCRGPDTTKAACTLIALTEASDSGQRTIEHEYRCRAPDTTDARCAALAAHLRRSGTWVTPTAVAHLLALGGVFSERLRFWPGTVTGMPFVGLKTTNENKDSILNKFNETVVPALAQLKRVGMPLLAGSDANDLFPEVTPGLSLHDELRIFVQAGFTPLEALQTATLNPAKYLDATDSLGTVETGKVADLVLLDANPLADITNASAIRGVIANGRYFDRASLDALIAGVEGRGRGQPVSPTP